MEPDKQTALHDTTAKNKWMV